MKHSFPTRRSCDLCTRKGFVGQRHAIFVDRCATQLVIAQLEVQLELVIGQLQNLDRLGHDLRADTITGPNTNRSEEHKSELQSLMRISYAFFCSKNKQAN